MDDMEKTESRQTETEEKPGVRLESELLGWLESIVISVIVVALLITFVGRIVVVDGHSMERTLLDQERIVTTPLYTGLERGDIVVIRRKDDTPLVKRVVAVAGETVDIDYADDFVVINGERLEESYINGSMNTPDYKMLEFPLEVPEGYIFVLGDNRNHSSDSRSVEIGLIDTRNVFGKAVFRVWPLDKMGAIS